MGFAIGCTELLIPQFFLDVLSVLDFIQTLILTLLEVLRVPGFARPEIRRDDPPQLGRPKPLSVSAVKEMLPAVKFSAVAGDSAAESCAVCLCEYEEEEEIRRLRNCRHVFHRRCLDRWMDHHQMTCPLCRSPLAAAEEHGELFIVPDFQFSFL